MKKLPALITALIIIISFLAPKIILAAAPGLAGINIDPNNPSGKPSAEDLKILGASWVRFVYDPSSNVDYQSYINELSQNNIKVTLVLNQETIWPENGINEAYVNSFANQAGLIAKQFGDKVSAYEIWNEQDQSSQSSLYINPESYASLLSAAYNSIKQQSENIQVISGGMVGGDPDYLRKVIAAAGGLPADGVGLHPYSDNVEAVKQTILNFLAVSQGKPMWITEFGWEVGDQQQQANYLKSVYELISQFGNQVSTAMWYGWSDAMNPGFGLIDSNGNPKLTFEYFMKYAAFLKTTLANSKWKFFPIPPVKTVCPTDEPLKSPAETKAQSYVVPITQCFLETKEQVAEKAVNAVMQIKDFQFPDNQKLTTNLNNSADILKLAGANPKIVKKTTQGKITFEACEEGTTTWFDVPRDKIITFQTPTQMSQQDSVGQELVGMLNPAGGTVKGESTTNTNITPQQFAEEPQANPCGYHVDAGIEILGQEGGQVNYKLWVCRNESDPNGTIGDIGIRRFVGGVEVGFHMENLWGKDDSHPDGGQPCLEYYPGDGGEQFMPTASSVEELNQTYWRVGNLDHNEGCADNILVTATNKPPPAIPPPPPRKCEAYNAKGLGLTPKNICSGGSCNINAKIQNSVSADAISQYQAALAAAQQAGETIVEGLLEKFGLCKTIKIVITAKISTPYGQTADNKLRQKTLPILNTGSIFNLEHAKQNMVEQFTASPTQEKQVETEIYGQAGIKNAYDKIQDQLRPVAN